MGEGVNKKWRSGDNGSSVLTLNIQEELPPEPDKSLKVLCRFLCVSDKLCSPERGAPAFIIYLKDYVSENPAIESSVAGPELPTPRVRRRRGLLSRCWLPVVAKDTGCPAF